MTSQCMKAGMTGKLKSIAFKYTKYYGCKVGVSFWLDIKYNKYTLKKVSMLALVDRLLRFGLISSIVALRSSEANWKARLICVAGESA